MFERDNPYEYMSQNPCAYCIEMECENNGNICPLWWKYNKADIKEVKELYDKRRSN